jgi:hypothetical protein
LIAAGTSAATLGSAAGAELLPAAELELAAVVELELLDELLELPQPAIRPVQTRASTTPEKPVPRFMRPPRWLERAG